MEHFSSHPSSNQVKVRDAEIKRLQHELEDSDRQIDVSTLIRFHVSFCPSACLLVCLPLFDSPPTSVSSFTKTSAFALQATGCFRDMYHLWGAAEPDIALCLVLESIITIKVCCPIEARAPDTPILSLLLYWLILTWGASVKTVHPVPVNPENCMAEKNVQICCNTSPLRILFTRT